MKTRTKVVLPNQPKTNFTTESALIFLESYDIELVRTRMNRNTEHGMFAEQVFGNFTISNSAFLRCVPILLKKKLISVQMHSYYTEKTILLPKLLF